MGGGGECGWVEEECTDGWRRSMAATMCRHSKPYLKLISSCSHAHDGMHAHLPVVLAALGAIAHRQHAVIQFRACGSGKRIEKGVCVCVFMYACVCRGGAVSDGQSHTQACRRSWRSPHAGESITPDLYSWNTDLSCGKLAHVHASPCADRGTWGGSMWR